VPTTIGGVVIASTLARSSLGTSITKRVDAFRILPEVRSWQETSAVKVRVAGGSRIRAGSRTTTKRTADVKKTRAWCGSLKSRSCLAHDRLLSFSKSPAANPYDRARTLLAAPTASREARAADGRDRLVESAGRKFRTDAVRIADVVLRAGLARIARDGAYGTVVAV
jgi:hypothetical protein